MLHVDSVTKAYGEKRILTDVYLSVEKGEVIALLGRNGSGKSTLLKIIVGIEKATSKFVRVGTKNIKSISDSSNYIHYVPQDNFLPKGVKIKRLLRVFLSKPKAIVLGENEYIHPLLDKTTEQLSGGERRLVELLMILNSDADYFLLDEPFNGLSPIARTYVMCVIKELRSSKGFVITDHDYINCIQLSDSLLFLKDGYLRKIAHPEELKELGYLPKSSSF